MPTLELFPTVLPDQLYPVRTAARVLRVTEVRVRQMIQHKTMRAEKVGRAWYIRGSEILRYEQNRRPIGRPKGSVVYKFDVLGRRRRAHRLTPSTSKEAVS